jgi:LEA14-like dessication related protein
MNLLYCNEDVRPKLKQVQYPSTCVVEEMSRETYILTIRTDRSRIDQFFVQVLVPEEPIVRLSHAIFVNMRSRSQEIKF